MKCLYFLHKMADVADRLFVLHTLAV